MKLLSSILAGGVLLAGTSAASWQGPKDAQPVRAYTVNRKVSDYAEGEDLTSPEAAYATLNRLSASGDQGFWRRLSVPPLTARMPEQAGKREVSARAAAEWRSAEIVEVHLWTRTNAVVLAKAGRAIDLRWLGLVNGAWLNEGNDVTSNLDEARSRVTRRRALREAEQVRSSRPPVEDPETHLRPFVEFLNREATDPQEFLLTALAKHRVVILGEVHNRQRHWALNAALARAPAFVQHVGVIYLELPRNN